jgi:ABC-type multidrug transport system permease subunit
MTIGCFAGYAGFDCSILWMMMIGLFFVAAVFRKNIAEGILDMDFSLIGGSVAGAITFIIMTYITHSMKWSGIIGLIGVVTGGFVGAQFLPDGESDSGGGDGWF